MGSVLLQSDRVEQRSRPEFWSRGLERMFGMVAVTTASAGGAMEAELERRDIADVALVKITGSWHDVTVDHIGNANGVNVLIAKTSGGSLVTTKGTFELRSGHAYLIDHRTSHILRARDRFEHLGMFIPHHLCAPARAFVHSSHDARLPLMAGSAALFAAAADAAYSHAPEMAKDAAPIVARSMVDLLNAALSEAAVALARPKQGLPSYHRMRIFQHAVSALQDHDVCMDSIAQAVQLSTRRIHQLLATDQMTLMQWIWAERLSQCHRRLVDAVLGGKRISDLAYEWGFSDPAHFSRMFKQCYNLSPSAFVKRANARPA